MSRNRQGGGYGRYRGRKSGGASTALKVIAVALAIVLVGLAVLMFFMQDYLVYGDDGVHFVPPWSSTQPSQSPSPAPTDSLPLVITDPPEETDPAPTQAAEQLRAVGVSQTALLAGTAAEQAAATGGNAVVLTMKNDDGTLNYVSAVPLAVEAGASGSDPNANAAIRALTGGDTYTVAQVSCFRDHTLPGYDAELAIHTNSGYRWLDFEDVRWASPAHETVTGYLVDLCVELAQLGFDEILLTNCGYPPAESGNLGWIRQGEAYPVGYLDGVLIRFLEGVRTALEPYGVKLSVRTQAKYLEGTDADTGLTPALLLNNCDRVWLPAGQVAAGLTYASDGDATRAEEPGWLIPVSTAPGGGEEAWAVLN